MSIQIVPVAAQAPRAGPAQQGQTRPAPEAQSSRHGEAIFGKPEIQTILSELAQVSAAFNKRLKFDLNEKLGEVVVKVVDSTTDTVIKEIPPQELQRVHERIREVIGLLFDQEI